MQRQDVNAIGQALAAARIDEVAALTKMLGVVIDVTGAREARLILLQAGTLEVWRLQAGGEVTLAVALDGNDDGFTTWRKQVHAQGSHTVMTSALPLAPGLDAGLLAVDVPGNVQSTDALSDQLHELALHAASLAAVSRADVERRIAVSAATNDDKLVKARQRAADLRRRAEWATNALTLVEADATFTQDAAAHLAELTNLVDQLVAELHAS